MKPGFEWFVAWRYLTARRKQAVISVVTAISVLGVAAGVMALITALAVTTGFRNTLQRNLLGATAHVMLLEKQTSEGIGAWRELVPKMRTVPGVRNAAPSLYGNVFFMSGQPAAGVIKGILPPDRAPVPEMLKRLKAGGFGDWKADSKGRMPLIMGSRLAQQLGLTEGASVKVITPQMSAFGQRLDEFPFRVAGIFECGYFDIDNAWAFTPLDAAQRTLGLGDVVNSIDMDIDDVFAAERVARAAESAAGAKYSATHWMEQNRQLLGALNMEKGVAVVVINLILMVAGLNILTSLIMMVMEKHRDIALLLSMGASAGQIKRIFVYQGLLIGAAGTGIGLVAGYGFCALAERWRMLPLDEAIYGVGYVPFEPRVSDALWIAGASMAVSLLATILPARNASRIAPAEGLRYE